MYDISYKIIKQNYLQNLRTDENLRKELAQTFNGQNKLYAKSSNELSLDFIKEFMNFPLNS